MKKVLVIDDNTEILNIISLILDSEGYDVKCSSTGYGVSALLESFPADVVLLDVMLGDLDGRDICNMLKTDQASKHIPIIMISASHNLNTIHDKGCYADAFIEKPFDIDTFAEVVGMVLK